MTSQLEKCAVCGALLDEEDLFCANCGTEAPHGELARDAAETIAVTFDCQGCGASMSYDASAGALRCPFCGNERLEEKRQGRTLAAQRIVPFRVDRRSAEAALRKWLGGSFWRPGDLAQKAAIEKMSAVYVPFWVFTAQTFTYWTADSSHAPLGSRSGWVPVSGEHRGSYSGLLIGASSALSPAETAHICPFDLHDAVAPHDEGNRDVIVEQFRVPRKYARPLARAGLEEQERRVCAGLVPGRARNVHVNVLLDGLHSEPVLLPVWIVAYRYRNELFRFLLNGQTGRHIGKAPVSWRKILLIVGVALLVLIAVFFAAALIGVLSGA